MEITMKIPAGDMNSVECFCENNSINYSPAFGQPTSEEGEIILFSEEARKRVKEFMRHLAVA
jgi:hypothetical protein